MALLSKPKDAPQLLGRETPEEEAAEGEHEKVTDIAAGYMELAGAKKDGDCRIVRVEGGISKDLGCCNLYHPKNEKVQQFKCGVCYFEA